MRIPIFDLQRQYRTIRKELNNAFTQTAANGTFILGKHVASFEKEFTQYVSTRYAIGLASGTDALMLGLKALGVGTEDEVILPANSYPSAFGVAMSGAVIKLVDVKEDGTMNPDRLRSAITKRTRAVIPVHLYGNPADLTSIQKIIGHKNIFLVEDAAQAHGTRVPTKAAKMKTAGSIGDIGCFSFYPTKNLGALGDAGMITTNSKRIADRLKRLRMYGETKRYDSREIAGISRLDELQSALLRVKLRHLPDWVARRRKIATIYIEGLTGVGDIRFVSPSYSAFHLFVIRTKKRNEMQTFLTRHGIGTAIHYPLPIHLVPSFRHLGYNKGDFPVSEALSRETLSLPMYPELTNAEVATVIQTIKKFFMV